MADVVIENPVINSPYDEPTRHFRFGEEGITNEIVEGNGDQSVFHADPAAPKKRSQLSFRHGVDARSDRGEQVHQPGAGEVGRGGGAGTWRDADDAAPAGILAARRPRATVVLLPDRGAGDGDLHRRSRAKVRRRLDRELICAFERGRQPGLFRIAFKMATGSGKTVVMAMLIAWQALNKLANPQDARFTDTFLIVTPGITIRDRLRVLLPNDPNNYYR